MTLKNLHRQFLSKAKQFKSNPKTTAVCTLAARAAPHKVLKPSATTILLAKNETDDLGFFMTARSLKLKNAPGMICFPGGGLKDGETHKLAAHRELVEEVPGMKVKKIDYCEYNYPFSYDGNFRHQNSAQLATSDDVISENIEFDANEVSKVHFFKLEDLLVEDNISTITWEENTFGKDKTFRRPERVEKLMQMFMSLGPKNVSDDFWSDPVNGFGMINYRDFHEFTTK